MHNLLGRRCHWIERYRQAGEDCLLGTDTDTTLLLRWHGQHDARAFRELASRHSGMVFATCRRVLGDAAEAEDVTQECFLALAQHAAKPPDSLPAWLHVLAVRQSLNRRRAASRRTQRERQYMELHSQSSASDWDAIMSEVDEVIAGLPEELGAAIVLYFLEERSQQEISERLGISQSTVSRRIDDGIAKVRKALARKGITLSSAALAGALRAQAGEALPASLSASLGKLALLANTGGSGAVLSGVGVTAATIGGIILMKKIGLVAGAVVIAIGGAWYATGNSRPEPAPSPEEPVVKIEPEPEREEVENEPDPAPVLAAVPKPEVGMGTISGRVYDSATEVGLEGVVVSVKWSTRPVKRASTLTDASGNYVLADLTGGVNLSYLVTRGTPTGYRPESRMATKSVQFRHGGSSKDVNFAVQREVMLEGIVVNTDNRPVADALVKLGGGADIDVQENVTSDRDGNFAFHNLPATSSLHIIATKGEDLVSQPYLFQLQEEGISDLVVVLETACTISGIVVDHEGHALPNFRVLTERRPHSRVKPGANNITDSAGHFEVRGLAPGPYELAAWNPDSKIAFTRNEGFEIDLQAGEHRSGLVLVYDRQLSIAGLVHDAKGNPVDRATVTVLSQQSGGDTALTDNDGAFEITNLQHGTYDITVNAKGYMFAEVSGIAAGTNDLTIGLPTPFRVTGTVTDERTGQPIPEFELVLTSSSGNTLDSWAEKQFERIADPNGRFDLKQTQLYRSIIAARAQGYSTAMQFLDLTGPPYKREVHLKLSSGGDLRGRVVDGRGLPIATAKVFFGGAVSVGDRATTTTNDLGQFLLKSFPVEGQLVSAYHENYAVGSLYVEPSHNRNQPVDIILPSGGWIQGTVRFAEGMAAVSSHVSVGYFDDHFINSFAEVQPNGFYEIDRVAPGEVVVSLFIKGANRFVESYKIAKLATVSEAEITTVDFDVLPHTARLEGVVTYPERSNPRRVNIVLKMTTNHGEVRKTTIPTADGSFVFEGIPAGSGTIEVAADFQNQRSSSIFVPVDVPEGETGYVAVKL